MTKSSKNAIMLVASAILLTSALLCIRFLPEKKQEETLELDTETIHVVNEPIDNIDNINIVNKFGGYSVLKNADKKLIIEELNNYPRNDSAYDDLANKVSSFIADKIVTDGNSNLEKYGLNVPQVQVSIKCKSNINIELFIGNEAPGNLGYYVKQKEDSKIYLVSSNNIAPFLKSKLDYISLSITSPKSADVNMKDMEYIELIGGNRPENIKITKNKTSGKDKNTVSYNIAEPINKKISNDGASIINSIENICCKKIEMIAPKQEDINNCGLNNPFVTLNLKYKNQDLITIYVALIPDSEDCFVMRKDVDIIYRVEKADLDWLEISVDGLTKKSNN